MGAQWKHAGQVANANKKGQIVGKLTKEIIVAAKMGGANMDSNFRLRAAVESARKASVTRDTIERAIKKGSGQTDETIVYELVTYEGFAPHQVPLIVECLTDNKNRTASDVRMIFRKGQLGSIGSVGWMFDRAGVVEATHKDKTLDTEGVAIEAGAQNVEPLEKADIPDGHIGARFICDASDLGAVSKFLGEAGWAVSLSELSYLAKSYPELTPEQRKEVSAFLGEVDDNDDVHRIYVALK
ncbi:MAG: YebC/PmpR family DNA-binding transcriptional regulator [Deltaproteobacteria bacterium]|nr:YebC/PmpR family DNA-binding transcriptional regulator [Deltaproteobacteria bacterium]